MSGEQARVEIETYGKPGDLQSVYLNSYVNGLSLDCPIHTGGVDVAEQITPELQKLISEVYRRAYRKGFADCGGVIIDALGLK